MPSSSPTRSRNRPAHISRLEDELSGLQKERETVRQRMERLLKQLDEVWEIER